MSESYTDDWLDDPDYRRCERCGMILHVEDEHGTDDNPCPEDES